MSANDPFSAHQAEIGRVLAQGVCHGRWTIEMLDSPSMGWVQSEADRRSTNSISASRGHGQSFPPPQPFRNLAREWIEANPEAWQQMLAQSIGRESRAA